MTFLVSNPDNETDGGTLELDGASSVVSADVGGFTYVFVAGGVDDGISVFRLLANGTLTPVDDVDDADNAALELDGARGLSTAMVDGNTYLFVAGQADNGVSVFRVGTNGSLTNVHNVTDDATMLLTGVSDTATARVGTSTYLYTAGTTENGISIFRVAGDGRLTYLSNQADAGTFELAGVRALTTVTIGATAFLIAGGTDDGISVFSINASTGALTGTDDENDTGAFNLNDVLDITTAVIGGVTYVFVAGAADHGISVFSLSGAGVLTHVESENDSTTSLFAGANSISVTVLGGITYLHVGGIENGTSLLRFDPSETAGRILQHVDQIADSGSRELSGTTVTGTASVGGTTYLLGAGSTDDGVSVFGTQTTGQVWYSTEGNLADARIAFVNTDGGNHVTYLDNNPTTTLTTGFVEAVAIDSAAGRYYAIVTGNEGINARLIMGQIGSLTPPTVVFTFDPTYAGVENNLAFHLDINTFTETLYVGFINFNPFTDAGAGIRQFSYNPTTGAVSGGSFLVTETTAQTPPATAGADGLFASQDMAFDTTNGVFYSQNLALGDGFETNTILRFSLASPGGAPGQILFPTTQFPLNGNGSDFTTVNGIIADIEVDEDSNRLYFLTRAEDVEENTSEDSLWVVFNASTANGTVNATEVTLIGINAADFYGEDMVLDEVNNILYIETENSNLPGGGITDAIMAFQLNAAGTTATLINTINLSFGTTANLEGMHFNYIAALSGISGTATPATEQGASLVLLTGAPTVTDFDGDHLASATVQITGGTFNSNENSFNDDDLGIGAGMTQSGLIAGTNITIAWNQATGTLTLTGYDTFANYQAALASVRYQATGDNPTNYGLNPTRTITWTVSDGLPGIPGGQVNSATTQLNITAVNDGPTNTVPGAQVIAEDSVLNLAGLSIADPDLNPAITDIVVTLTATNGTLTLLTNVAGGLIAADIANNGSGVVTITATRNEINATFAAVGGLAFLNTPDYNGPASVQIVTNDGGNTGTGGALGDTDTINITVNAVVDIANDAPSFAEDSGGGAQTIDVLANDTFENAARFISSVTQGLHGTVTIVDGPTTPGIMDYVVYTQVGDYNGTDSFTYTVTSGGVTEVATVNVTITAVDDSVLDTPTVGEDSGTTTVDVLGNDSFENAARFISGVTQGANGTVTIVDGPTTPGILDYVTYTPVADYNGSDSFTYTVTSGGVTEVETVNVTVTAVADIADDNVDVNEDSGVTNLDLLFNDSFENAGRAITSVTQGVNGGTVAINTNGTGTLIDDYVTYSPSLNYNGPDSFTYTVTSGGVTETATVNVTVNPVNDAPTQTGLHGDTATWTEGGAATLLDLGSNMTLADIDSADFDGGTLTVLLSGGVVAQDGIFIETVGGVTSTANTVSVGATQIATYTGGGFGGGNIVFTFNADATPAAVQALMRALSYNNNGGDNPTAGTRSVTWTLVDGDGTLNGGADTLLIGSFVDVVAVNDAPEGGDNTLALDEDGTRILTQGNFFFSDPGDSNAFAGVVITTLPTNGSLLLNGTPITVAGTFVTAVQINSNQLVFQPDPNENGTPYGSFTFQVRDNGGILNGGQDTDQSANTLTFNVNPVNDAPVNTVPGAQSVNEEGTLTFNAANGNLISIADVDAGAADLTTTVSIADGALNVGATMAGLAVTGAGTNTLILVGTLAEINDALDGLTYAPPANANGPRTLTVATNDGGATGADPGLTGDGDDEADSDPITITINSVNDEPAGSNGTVTASEDDPYVFTAADFGFTDPLDSNLFAGVVLTSLPIEGDLRLNGVNITVAGTFITAADIASGLLTFLADPDEFGAAYASFDFQVRDDGGILNGGQNTDQSANTMTIDVTADNFVPVVDLNSGTPGVNDTNLYVENGGASGLGTAITVTDNEGDMITGAVITITDPSAGDLLSANLPLPGGITVHASSTATMIVLTGTASAANYATALGQLGYSNTGEDPTAGGNTDRVITVTVSDATGTSAPATMTMAVSPINDEPILTATGASQTLTEGGAAVDLFSTVSASTVEAGQTFTSLTLTVTNVTDGAAETLTFDGSTVALTHANAVTTATNGLNVTVTVVGSTATVTFSGATLSAAALQTLVDNLTYGNSSENPTDADRVVTITQIVDSGSNTPPNDNTATPNIAATVNVDPVNDGPVNTVPGAQTINEDGSFTLSAGNGNAIQVADADAATLTVTLTVAQGTLTLASTAGLTFSGGSDGTADATMTFSGTAVDINAALGSGLTYNPTANYNGPDSISVLTTDNGQTGTGGTLQDNDSIAITINSVNDAPTGADNTLTGSEDDPLVLTAADFGFTDTADSNAFFAVRIMTFPANGTLYLDSDGPGGAAPVDLSTVGPGVYVSITDINAGELYFQPDPDEFGNGYATFTFAVQDDGGTTNGGQDTDQSPNTMTINIAQDNVPPAVDLDGGTGGINYTASYTEDALGVAIGSGVTVTDPNSGTGDMIESATIVLTDRVAGDSLTITGALPPGIIAVTTPTAGAITIQITGAGTGAQYQALIESIQYATTSQDPTVGGTDLARTITVTVNDGTIDSAVATTTVNITATDDAPVAQPDAYTITEAGSIVGGNVFANNGSGLDSDPDGPPLTVSAVSGGTVGVQFMLPSGALLTMNANGTFNYNPNGAFDFTPTSGSGAVNTPSVDQFDYTLNGGGTATVTVTITGLDTNDTLIGSAAADTLNAGVGNDYIDGLAGADSMAGASGNDTYIVDDAGDAVIETSGQGSDVVYARTSYALGGGSHVETLAAIDNSAATAMALVGNEFANNIQGNQGANFIDGNGGADIMAGFSGNDVYVVDNAGDLVLEGVGRGNDIVYARISYTLMAGAEVETLAAIDNSLTDPLVLIGNEFANTIYGNEGANHLDGGAGADAMVGFGGDDVYIVDNAGDAVFEDAGDGSDTVFARASYTLTAGSEVEILAAIDNAALTAINLTGNALANNIQGNSGANVINGGGGSDILAGFGGADTYQFTSALGGGNVAYIFEFSGIASDGDDIIALDDAVFTGLSLGALDPGAIVAGPAAQDADDRIIYDSSTGSLYFDADGNGAGAMVLFAVLLDSPALSAGDFTVI